MLRTFVRAIQIVITGCGLTFYSFFFLIRRRKIFFYLCLTYFCFLFISIPASFELEVYFWERSPIILTTGVFLKLTFFIRQCRAYVSFIELTGTINATTSLL
ncbi:unnamed protein product [Phytomonas sp. EM1]|nr:unnamed protein product [Phytomonas sp. EM1]|eukprot:CCW61693.1 unnamed protein product [Phytomonas sp. isolate EM1]